MTTNTCSCLDNSSNLFPIADAVAPPTPLSISSKICVFLLSSSKKHSFAARRNLDNSPPEAILLSGLKPEPGLISVVKQT